MNLNPKHWSAQSKTVVCFAIVMGAAAALAGAALFLLYRNGVQLQAALGIKSALVRQLTYESAQIVVGVGFAGTVVSCACVWWITRIQGRQLLDIAGTLSEVTAQVTEKARRIESASGDLSDGAANQAASIEETSASLEQTASRTGRNAEGANLAEQLSGEIRGEAEASASEIEELTRAMEQISKASDTMSETLKRIDGIAFQTKILALNAAVEAARAGAVGEGFAVVATEVQSLALKCSEAAKQMAERLAEARVKNDQGKRASQVVASRLESIRRKVKQGDELLRDIGEGCRDQSRGIGEIHSAMAQIDSVTQKNVARAEESATVGADLARLAAELGETVNRLSRVIHGEGSGSRIPG